MILSHESAGEVVETGSTVAAFEPADGVVITLSTC